MPEERRREEERDGVVAVPPLHERVLHARVDRVALERARPGIERLLKMWRTATVTKRRDVEPDRDVEVPLAAPGDRAEAC